MLQPQLEGCRSWQSPSSSGPSRTTQPPVGPTVGQGAECQPCTMEAHSQQLQRGPGPGTHITLQCERLCYSTDLKANDPITFLFQLLLHPLQNRASFGNNDNILGTFHFGFIYSPILRVWRKPVASPINSSLPFIKYLSGIFLSLAHRSFNITLDILSFMDGNRGRTGGIKITCMGRQAAAGPRSGC